MKLVIDLLTLRAGMLRGNLEDDRNYVAYLREQGRHSEAGKTIHRIEENEALLGQIEDAIETLEET